MRGPWGAGITAVSTLVLADCGVGVDTYVRQVDDLDEIAAVDPRLRAVGLGEVRDVPEPRPVPVRPSGRIALIVGAAGFAMLRTYMTEPRSRVARSLTTSSVLPHESTSSFSKWGRGQR